MKPPLLVIVGETASGKSALAMELAERFRGELIAADSWTVYKGFDIGTAKPTLEDQAQIPHHLIDVANPAEGFSAAQFKQLAELAIADISNRGKLPILVGGTGLYVDSILYDYSFLPKSEPLIREKYNAMSLSDLLALADERGLDMTGIDMRNSRRVIRHLENDGKRPAKHALRENTCIIGIARDSAELRRRIGQRVEAMVAAGFMDEVRRLGAQYGWDVEPMRAPGYRASADYVKGLISLEEARQRFVRNDLQLAKKQRTWFKRNNSIQWVENSSESVAITTSFLNK